MSSIETSRIHQVMFGSELIEFRVQTSRRTTLAINVHPDMSVSVIAPKNAPLDKIEAKVRKRAPWIIKQKIYFAQFLPSLIEKEYLPGEAFRYLGRQYRLKVAKLDQERVALDEGNIRVSLHSPHNKNRVKELISDWYRCRAHAVFEARVEATKPLFRGLNLPEFRVLIRRMNFRWGSCTKSGIILLNQDLIQAPTHCIDYVICHELTHLRVRNHTPEFFRILSRVMPDWEVRRKRLERLAL